jgi:hypothetical protein
LAELKVVGGWLEEKMVPWVSCSNQKFVIIFEVLENSVVFPLVILQMMVVLQVCKQVQSNVLPHSIDIFKGCSVYHIY